jgi:hypothetical protein
MAKENVKLRLDGDQLRELRELVGAADLAAVVDAAIATHLTNLHQLKEADEWIEDLKRYDEAKTLAR